MNSIIYKAGYWSALLAFVATLAFDIAQLLQLISVLTFPADQVFIFGFSLCIIGYICMGLATLFAVPVFKKTGFQKWVRYCFLTHALVTPLIAFVYFYPDFSDRLLLIAIPWSITAPLVMLLLAIMFQKELTSDRTEKNFRQYEKSKQLNMTT